MSKTGKQNRILSRNNSRKHKLDISQIITEERTPQKRIMALPEMIEMLFKVCSETTIFCCIDTKGVILNISEVTARRFGKPKKCLIGKSLWEVLPPETAALRKQIFAKVLETGHIIRFEDQRDDKWLDSIVFPVHDESNRIAMVIVIGFDISPQKEDERHLKEEKLALEQIVAERTANLVNVNRELHEKTQRLEEMNVALRVLLEQRDRDRQELEKQVLKNVEQLVKPSLERAIEFRFNPDQQQECVKVAVANLDNIVSPFLSRLSAGLQRLTPQELQVANLIKANMTTKAIAKYMSLSGKTVEVYRRHIRKKLGLTEHKANLRTHLLSYQ
jgi:PAS domain S-box-containing protein